MTNEQIASTLGQIAQLLQIEGANTFRIRSYERAAEAIRGLGEELSELRAGEGGLEAIPGIGEAIAQKIEELLDTGELAYLTDLLAQYPEGFLELLKIPGLGPKRAALVYHELGVGTVDQLEEACVRGQVRELKGMGEKSERKLLEAIGRYWQGRERALLGEILPRAEEMVAFLLGLDEVIGADYAGSARRGRETVGDLDLLATSDDPGAVCRAFAAAGILEAVELAGETKVSGTLPGGRQVDLRVVEPGSWGAALVYFTGSQQHNIRLRERGQDRGLRVNEYGVFRDPGDAGQTGVVGERMAGETEQSVYEALDLTWIPPELREDRGEIQAAEASELPDLVELPDIRCDLHMHTNATDGRASIEEMAEAARALGYTHIGITDHSRSLYVAEGISAPEVARQREEIDALNAGYEAAGRHFRVLLGHEADILSDGALDADEEVLGLVDYVIGAIHQGMSADADRMTDRVIRALTTGLVDMFAHPTGRILLGRDAYGLHVSEVVEAAVAHDVALEINAAPDRLDLSDVHARLATERGAKLTINTDAHRLEHFDFMRYGVLTARRGWVEARSVINTWPLPDLLAWLASRR
ncbi:MAG: DNA polymerase/3'-5' exonuclease PolX [Armatimonadota bacterium]|jgi:DNA polymerase (family 10)